MDEYHVNTAEQPDDVIRLAHSFNYEGYQVVRQEFLPSPLTIINSMGTQPACGAFPPRTLCRCSSTGSENF